MTVPFVQLHGVEFIGLGAVDDERTPRQRIDEMLQQVRSNPGRLVHIGYLLGDGNETQSVSLEAYQRHYPNDAKNNLQRPFPSIIQHIVVSVE